MAVRSRVQKSTKIATLIFVTVVPGLSCFAKEATPLQIEPNTNNGGILSGQVSAIGIKAEFGKVTVEILNLALRQNTKYQKLENELNMKHPVRDVTSRITGALGEVVSMNATAASKDGAKIVLDETENWDDKDSLKLNQQRIIDELHPKITSALLQVAMGKGSKTQDSKSLTISKQGFHELVSLSGSETSILVNDALARWSSETVQSTKHNSQSDDLTSCQKQVAILTEAAVQDDPVLIAIKAELQKFARPNKLHDHLNNTLQTILDSTAYMMPTASIAAAVVAVKGVLVVNTGGPEEDKLQHLLILVKRFSSRKAALNEEIQMAVHARGVASQTENRLLGKCADAVIDNLVTPKTLARITCGELAESAAQPSKGKE